MALTDRPSDGTLVISRRSAEFAPQLYRSPTRNADAMLWVVGGLWFGFQTADGAEGRRWGGEVAGSREQGVGYSPPTLYLRASVSIRG